ncbi:uncharacterized protein BROUX77_006126 [Berkeleyomyces rouxiae]|uniref:uncharacterized protein n=1 Tax=Berkeleyomyces rouxiae TaxID=2035830 RepID=UPI003B7A6F4A
MKLLSTLFHATTVVSFAIPQTTKISGRALPDSPSGGYAPVREDCPSERPAIRDASDGILNEETEWLKRRDKKTGPAFLEFVKRVKINDFDIESYLSQENAQPRLAAAISGGGYRSFFHSAGILKAADDRTPGSLEAGGIGGLLQSMTYVASLSGGSWMTGSMFFNNFTGVHDLQNNHNVWQLQNNVIKGPPSTGKPFQSFGYISKLKAEVNDKYKAGFEVGLADYWGRALMYQMVEGGGEQYTYSSIANTPSFTEADMPMPIIVAVGREPDTVEVNLNSTVFETSPFEFGSWDDSPSAFVPIRYLGSSFDGGILPESEKCVRGYDSVSFVVGASSSLFNAVTANKLLPKMNLSPAEDKVLQTLANQLHITKKDVAVYKPNPFYNFQESTNKLAKATELDLVDGAMDGQMLPLWSLIQPSRAVDVIYSIDSGGDTEYYWPNGTSLRSTWERTIDGFRVEIPFPPVPDDNTFVNLKLNQRPSFFGCEASNFTAGLPPLIVYLPNAPMSHMSNVSTFTMAYELEERDNLILNGYNVGTQGNSTSWGTCLACAALSRSFTRTGTTVPQDCVNCFKEYCWDGSIDITPAKYEPTPLLG